MHVTGSSPKLFTPDGHGGGNVCGSLSHSLVRTNLTQHLHLGPRNLVCLRRPQMTAAPEGTVAGLSTDYLRAADAAERLQQNLDKDHALLRRFTAGVLHQARPSLSHVQGSRT